MEERETDDWAFRKLGPEAGVSVVERYNEIPQASVSLFDISNGDSETALFAAAGSNAIVIGKVEALFKKLAINSELETTSISVNRPLLVKILANASQIAVYDQQNELAIFSVDGTKQWSSTIEGITQLEKHPSQATLAYVCNGDAFMLTDSNVQKLGEANRVCFNDQGSPVLGTDSSVSIGHSVIELPKAGQLIHLQCTGPSIFAVISQDDEYTAFLYANGSWTNIPDACPPFGDDSRYLTWYSGAVTNWIREDPLIIVASASQSSDMLLATSSEILSPLEDADRASMPFTEDETSPVGASVYTGSSFAPPKGFAGVEETAPMPIWMVLTNEGSVTAWALLSRQAIKSGSTLHIKPSISAELNPQRKLSSENTASELVSKEVVDPDLLGGLSVSTETSRAEPRVEAREIVTQDPPPKDTVTSNKAPEPAPNSTTSQNSLFGAVPSTFGSSWGSSSAFGTSQSGSAPTMQFNFSTSTQGVTQKHAFSLSTGAAKESPFGAISNKNVFSSEASSPFASLRGDVPSTQTNSTLTTSTNDESNRPKSIFNLDNNQKKENENPFGNLNASGTSIFGKHTGETKSIFDKSAGEEQKSIFGKLSSEQPKSIYDKSTGEEQKSIFGKLSSEQPKSIFDKPAGEEQKSIFGKLSSEQPKSIFDKSAGEEQKSIFGKLSSEQPKSIFEKSAGEEQKSFFGNSAAGSNSTLDKSGCETKSFFNTSTEKTDQGGFNLGSLGETLESPVFPNHTVNHKDLPKIDATNVAQNPLSGINPVSVPDLDEESEATDSEANLEENEIPITHSQEESLVQKDNSHRSSSDSEVSLIVSESESESDRQPNAVDEPLGNFDANEFSDYEEVLDPNEITYAEFPPEDEELLDFSVPEPSVPLSDLDSVYAETNQLFQVLDYNLQVLENLTTRVKTQKQYPETPDLLDFEKWTLESVPELSSVIDMLAEKVKKEEVGDDKLQSAGILRQSLEESFVEINEVAESLVHMRRDLSAQAQHIRPLPFTAAKLQRHMRDQLETVQTKLNQCETLVLNLKAKQNPPRVADINLAMDIVEGQVDKLSNTIASLNSHRGQPLGASDISVYSASILGLSEMKEYDEAFVDQQRRRKFIEKVGASLRNRTL